jgi:hypothetical protein
MRKYEAHDGVQLLGGIFGATKGRMLVRLLAHLRIAIGEAESIEIERPDVEPGRAQRVPPRAAAETVRDGQRGWKGGSMDIEDGATMLPL